MKAKTARKPKKTWLPRTTRRAIAKEAASLNMTPQEYLRLLVSLGSNLRQSFPDSAQTDVATCLRVMESPLVGVVLRLVSQSVIDSVRDGKLDVSSLLKQWLPNEKEDKEDNAPKVNTPKAASTSPPSAQNNLAPRPQPGVPPHVPPAAQQDVWFEWF